MFSCVKTVTSFLVACMLSPCIISLYCVNCCCRWLRYRILQHFYPYVEFLHNPSLRSILDTNCNQGITTLLLIIRGKCYPQQIKKKLMTHILERRTPEGVLQFPYFRKILGSRFIYYYWKEGKKEFSVDNHVITAEPLYRGCLVTEENIQDVVNDFCIKNLPKEIPPWQVVLIRLHGPEEKFCMLLRIHHLVSDEIKLTELLKATFAIPWSDHIAVRNEFGKTVAIKKLCSLIWKAARRKWQVFLKKYDPQENPSVMQKDDTVTFLAHFGLALLSLIKHLLQKCNISSKTSSESDDKISKYPSAIFVCLWLIYDNFKKYNIAFWTILRVIFKSFMLFWPLTLLSFIKHFIQRLPFFIFKTNQFLVSFPYVFYRQCKILWYRENQTYELIRQACSELSWIVLAVFYWPRMLFEELLTDCESHPLQRMTFSGRKCVAWSDHVSLEIILKIRAATGVTVNEILMAACTGGLRDFFMAYGTEIPNNIHTTVPLYNDNFIETKETEGSGMVTLSLPTGLTDTTSILKTMKFRVEELKQYPEKAWASVLLLQNVTKVLPSLLLKTVFNYLTRKYSVVTTNVQVPESSLELFGQPVEEVLFWRPPQANTSMSLSVICYKDRVCLALMTDHLISPQHRIITAGFRRYIGELAASAGVQCENTFSHESQGISLHTQHIQSKRNVCIFPDDDSD